jgi:hypothetical protein
MGILNAVPRYSLLSTLRSDQIKYAHHPLQGRWAHRGTTLFPNKESKEFRVKSEEKSFLRS